MITVKIQKDNPEMPQQQAYLNPTEKVESGRNTTANSAVNTLLINYGMQVLNKGVANVGNLTGNYILQEQINQSLNVAGSVLAIAKGGITGLAAVGLQTAFKIFENDVAFKKATNEINYLLQSKGVVVNSGGRYV